MYKTTFLGVLEAEKLQKHKCTLFSETPCTQHTSDMDVSKIKDNVAEDVPIHSCNRRVDRPTVCVGRRKLDCCWNGERLA